MPDVRCVIDFGGRRCCLAATRDVTELKRTQSRLEESERRFQAIFAAMPGSTAIINSKGTVIDLRVFAQGRGRQRDDVG
jgi:PAS domain-containing protein